MPDTITLRTMTACAILVAALLAAPAVAAERLNDKDVKQLIEQVNNDRDRFEDQLDGKLKRSIIRGPGGEVNVERYLDDLQENVNKLKDRFASQYAASAEVTTILRQGSDIQGYMSTLPPDFNGASEWNRLSGNLGKLAAAYATTFPIAAGQQARRLNDAEVKKAAEDIGKAADQFKKELDSSLKKDKTVDAATRAAAVTAADGLKEDAKRLASLVGAGRPASGEAQALVQRATAVRAASSARALTPAAKTAWGSVEGGLDQVGQAFGLATRLP
jgi:hypothetical protein